MLGATWTQTLDAALEEISRLGKERQVALDALTRACRHDPYLEHDPDITTARLALLH